MNIKVALVTGATSGLGKAFCTLLASKDISLIITGKDQAKLNALAVDLKVPVITVCANLEDVDSRQRLVHAIKENAPDLIINSAGIGFYGDALVLSTQEQLAIMEVNANAVMEISIEGARAMNAHKKKGVIMNISSAAAFLTFPAFSAYAASKACVTHFSQSFDREVKHSGVRVLVACPGQIDTDFRRKAAKGASQAKSALAMTPKKAAQLIWQQIQQKQGIKTIGPATSFLMFLARLVPKKILSNVLQSSIKKRLK